MRPDDEVAADADGNYFPAAGRDWSSDDARPLYFGGFNSPQHNASAFDANGFYCSGDRSPLRSRRLRRLTVHGRKIRSIGRRREDSRRRDRKLLLRHPAVIHAALVSMER